MRKEQQASRAFTDPLQPLWFHTNRESTYTCNNSFYKVRAQPDVRISTANIDYLPGMSNSLCTDMRTLREAATCMYTLDTAVIFLN